MIQLENTALCYVLVDIQNCGITGEKYYLFELKVLQPQLIAHQPQPVHIGTHTTCIALPRYTETPVYQWLIYDKSVILKIQKRLCLEQLEAHFWR